MFVDFILRPIWSIFGAVIPTRDTKLLLKIITSMDLHVRARDIRENVNASEIISTIISTWLPLPTAILQTVVSFLPDPIEAQKERVPHLLAQEKPIPDELLEQERQEVTKAMVECEADSPHAVAFISKVHLRSSGELIGIGRLFSGTLKKGMTIRIHGPKYSPLKTAHLSHFEIDALYMVMGNEYSLVDSVPAGNVFGIGGVQGLIVKTATLSTTAVCLPFGRLQQFAPPMVRVAVEPHLTGDMAQLREGLRILNVADSGVNVYIQPTGEMIIAAMGEMHLARCLAELENNYAKVSIAVSEPIVSYQETIVDSLARLEMEFKYGDEDDDEEEEEEVGGYGGAVLIGSDGEVVPDGEKDVKAILEERLAPGDIIAHTNDKSVFFRIEAHPLPDSLWRFLQQNQDTNSWSSSTFTQWLALAEEEGEEWKLN
eukprot:TRINITY_DN469_c1_g1_i1.p1 TRINITY_DN469_c1_g1~~TRINITY_DN469_c1_g1_i1.p1  ORF type:complete len:496 (-),score=122.85 TRINITY_DN469_c1_g1_i1:121-1407(-)